MLRATRISLGQRLAERVAQLLGGLPAERVRQNVDDPLRGVPVPERWNLRLALTRLGHAEYGSRLHELVGEPNTPEARQRARVFILQAVAQERRVARVLELTVQPPDQLAQDRLQVFLRVQPATGLDPVALGIEVAL